MSTGSRRADPRFQARASQSGSASRRCSAWLEAQQGWAGCGRRSVTRPYHSPDPGRSLSGVTRPESRRKTMPARQRGQIVQARLDVGCALVRRRRSTPLPWRFRDEERGREWVDRRSRDRGAPERGTPRPVEIPTVSELVERFLATHEVDPATTDKLRYELRHATRAFGDKRIDQLRTPDLAAWRATLPARSRHQLFRSFRQVLEQAVTWKLIERNPSDRIRNRRVEAGREPRDPAVRRPGTRRGDRGRTHPGVPGAAGRSSSGRGCGRRRRSRSSGATSTRRTRSPRSSGSTRRGGRSRA